MAIENVKKFFELVKSDEELAREIAKIKDEIQNKGETVDYEQIISKKVIPLAKEHGLDFTMEDFLKYTNSMVQQGELSDDDLLNVSGGMNLRQGLATGFLLLSVGTTGLGLMANNIVGTGGGSGGQGTPTTSFNQSVDRTSGGSNEDYSPGTTESAKDLSTFNLSDAGSMQTTEESSKMENDANGSGAADVGATSSASTNKNVAGGAAKLATATKATAGGGAEEGSTSTKSSTEKHVKIGDVTSGKALATSKEGLKSILKNSVNTAGGGTAGGAAGATTTTTAAKKDEAKIEVDAEKKDGTKEEAKTEAEKKSEEAKKGEAVKPGEEAAKKAAEEKAAAEEAAKKAAEEEAAKKAMEAYKTGKWDYTAISVEELNTGQKMTLKEKIDHISNFRKNFESLDQVTNRGDLWTDAEDVFNLVKNAEKGAIDSEDLSKINEIMNLRDEFDQKDKAAKSAAAEAAKKDETAKTESEAEKKDETKKEAAKNYDHIFDIKDWSQAQIFSHLALAIGEGDLDQFTEEGKENFQHDLLYGMSLLNNYEISDGSKFDTDAEKKSFNRLTVIGQKLLNEQQKYEEYSTWSSWSTIENHILKEMEKVNFNMDNFSNKESAEKGIKYFLDGAKSKADGDTYNKIKTAYNNYMAKK